MSYLSDFLHARSRFSRSANVERDHGLHAIEGYIPTGRAVDVVARIARGLLDPTSGRTFSITGPHGVGKSSLAVFLDGLLAQNDSPEYAAAHEILQVVNKEVNYQLVQAIGSTGVKNSGFIRAFGTARVEPISATIARALHAGAERCVESKSGLVPDYFRKAGERPVSTSAILDTVKLLSAIKPVVLVIDEFGKNLEAYAASGDQGDPYLLQELAELTQGENPLPLVVITMQHLAFDEYVQETSAARRREWAKVQGRFHDIPYVETQEQSRRLVIASLERTSRKIDAAASKWVRAQRTKFEELGLRDVVEDAKNAIPLHPVTLTVLPDLCARYGQNERTLFSFMAGSEPMAVPAFLQETEWSGNESLPLLGLDRVYDYFLDSAITMIGVSDSASRWLEIETRIRDSAGLSASQLRALKSIGVLNLVSSGGRVRASRAMLHFCLTGSDETMESPDSVDQVLRSLEDAGLVVYRTFSDEFRVWQGSDYDLRRAIESARRQCVDTDLASLLNSAAILEPTVAGRHSQRRGVLRVFQQQFSNLESSLELNGESWDGVVLYATSEAIPRVVDLLRDTRPVVVVSPGDLTAVREAALEAASLQLALRAAEEEKADWVATRELVERTAAAQQRLRNVVAQTWTPDSTWTLANRDEELSARSGISTLLSDVCDLVYPATPRVANEMIARRELTSQGAKARRILLEALIEHSDKDCFGLDGYGPERAVYEALFRSTGAHVPNGDGSWSIQVPTDPDWRRVWCTIEDALRAADEQRVNLLVVCDLLAAPPIGLKAGIFPVLITTCLVHLGEEIALYEHGSLVLRIDDAVAERLARNPGHFSARNTGIHGRSRSAVVQALAERLKITSRSVTPTFLNVATAIFRELRLLPPYTQKTKRGVSARAVAVRNAFQTASEPDVLIFETLPKILGLSSFTAQMDPNEADAQEFADRLAGVIVELRSAYDSLLESVRQELIDATSVVGPLPEVHRRLTAQAAELDGRILEPRLKAFVTALGRPLDDREWLENVAMVVSGGQPPRGWTDEIALSFPLKAAELGGAMRRTQALLYDRLAATAEPDRFASSRLTLTHPDGREQTHFLAITDREKETIDEYLEPILAQLMELCGSRAAACQMLMARLAIEDTSVPEAITSANERKEAGHG